MDGSSGKNDFLLEKLFAGNSSSFHHRLGLHRQSGTEFYGPSGDRETILAEKRAILDSEATANLQLLETDEGRSAFLAFTGWVGLNHALPTEQGNLRVANLAASLAVEPDYLLMVQRDGVWRLAWASVCFPTRWSLMGKGGQSLEEIHGVVPGLNGQVGQKIGTFFARLISGEGWGRANWGLATSARCNQHPALPYEPLTGATP